MSYLGWSVEDWKKFHYESTPDESFELLSQLLKSQKLLQKILLGYP